MSRLVKKAHPDAELDMPTMSEMDGVRCMHFGSPWIQGAMQISNPANLVFLYTRQMVAWLLFLQSTDVRKIAVLGLGAGSLARFCLRHTKAAVEVVEWNPAVTAFCQQFFRLPNNKRLSITHADARDWVADPRNHNTCQIMLVDLYDYTAQGPVADSLSFYQHCQKVVGDLGIVAINLFGHHHSFPKNIRNINRAFKGRVLMFDETEDGNRIVLGFSGPALQISQDELMVRARVVERFCEFEAQTMAQELLKPMRQNAEELGLIGQMLVI